MTGRVRWILPLSALPFLGLLLFGLFRNPDFFPTPLIGQPAPAWHLETLEGDSLSLEELRGKVVLLNFWASWCIPCRTEHSVLLRADRSWPESDVRIIGIVYQDSRRNAEKFLEELGNSWQHVLDSGSRTAMDYGVYGPPESFFIAKDGHVVKKHIGPLNWNVVVTTIDSLLTESTSVAGPE